MVNAAPGARADSLVLAAVAEDIRQAGNISSANSRGGSSMKFRPLLRSFAAGVFVISTASSAQAAACGGNFDAWLSEFKTEAAAKGIAQNAIAAALSGVTPDQSVLSRDKSQRVFSQSFEEFSTRMIAPRLGPGS